MTYQIDPESIPEGNRFEINLSLDNALVRTFFVILITTIRIYCTFRCILVGGKFRMIPASTKHAENFYMISFVNGEHTTKVILALDDLYVYGALCNGIWYYARNDKYTIRGGFKFSFREGYSKHARFIVGLDELRNSVFKLHGNNPGEWASAYYSMAVNISECARFNLFFFKFLHFDSIQLTLKEVSIIRDWSHLSKLWKFYARYGVWNPDQTPCEVGSAAEAEEILGIVKDVSIAREIKKLDVGRANVDRTVL